MANIAETPVYTANIYEIATTDPVEGGPGGMANTQAQALANRTAYLKAVLDAMWPPFSIREIDVPAASIAAYKAANFDITGLGLPNGLWSGYAICNGANGTRDRGGRVAMGDGNGYTTGQTGGSKDAVLVAHTHKMFASTVQDGGQNINDQPNRQVPYGALNIDGDNYDYVMGSTTNAAVAGNTSSAGVSGTDKNLQPYIVTLFLQKL